MKKILVTSMGLLICLITGGQSFASQLRAISYEDVREEGGFNAPGLRDVMELTPGGRNLSLQEVQTLTTSQFLTNLRVLNLTNQQLVTDAVIAQIAENPVFSRIITLKLGSTSITDASIKAIADSPYLGSVRDLPQISGRHCIPSSVVKVYTQDTEVTDTDKKEKFEFHIEYRPPNPTYPWEPVNHGVKIVEIESW